MIKQCELRMSCSFPRGRAPQLQPKHCPKGRTPLPVVIIAFVADALRPAGRVTRRNSRHMYPLITGYHEGMYERNGPRAGPKSSTDVSKFAV